MSEITYNEEVTAEALNNIGVDLGLTEFSVFENNMPYAVHQLNQITSDLVSPGVLRAGEDGALGCEVIASEGIAYVQPGVIVFASGAKIRINEPKGVELIPGTYIYATADSITGAAGLEVSTAEPTGDYVMLAAVDAEGTLADRRSASVARVMLTADAQNVYREYTTTVPENYSGTKSVELNVGTNAFLYVAILGGKSSKNELVAYGNNMVKLEDSETVSKHMGRNEGEALYTIHIKREGQILTIDQHKGTDLTINLMIV